jgi:Fe-S-cluster-containing dehydrogenase component/DMSO reductase anchor subunit
MTLLELPTIRRVSESPLIGAFLAEQQKLTAVERFAQAKQNGEADRHNTRLYHDLIPLAAPQPGEQYAFTVDLDACSGCKACVTACHSLNGLDECETFRDVGALVGRDIQGLHVLQNVTTACHHCVEPACLAGCPTRAYDKDPVTGIVRHLDDQCIGCQYCTLMCPYDVPKYNAAKGIVRKCDMCHQRLVDGEAPACVQACPNQAIRIELVKTAAVRERSEAGEFVPHAPDPRVTLPTTRFTSKRILRDIEPVNGHDRPEHWHWPLVVMLVLTQMSIGMFFVATGLLLAGDKVEVVVIAAALIGLVGLGAAPLHLGRPQIAYRAWLGWRTSWMSREIIAFGLFATLAAITVLCERVGLAGTKYSLLLSATCLSGAIAIYCSAMIYVATRREFWTARYTMLRFFITSVFLGLTGTLAVLAGMGVAVTPTLSGLIVPVALVRIFFDIRLYEISRSAELLLGPLSRWNRLQAVTALLGGVILPLLILEAPQFSSPLTMALAPLLLAAELIHRGLFFAASDCPHMPGVPSA